jgi:Lon protease-like protein
VVLFPDLQLPLHVFEPRYRELVGSALARDRRIAMIQPQSAREGAPLFSMGCVGRINDVEALEDGRYNIVLEGEARDFADRQGYSVDWGSVAQLDDLSLINGVSQIAPFDAAAKQALLEAPDIATRCELLVQLMQFFGRSDPDEGRVTLQ